LLLSCAKIIIIIIIYFCNDCDLHVGPYAQLCRSANPV
jgi:hypothetical protein